MKWHLCLLRKVFGIHGEIGFASNSSLYTSRKHLVLITLYPPKHQFSQRRYLLCDFPGKHGDMELDTVTRYMVKVKILRKKITKIIHKCENRVNLDQDIFVQYKWKGKKIFSN